MKNIASILPCYAADTAGVCSALYELGGMTVVHDASGCNSTYATHDEPRWYHMQSKIFISALTELDAILGDDEKFISDVCDAAYDMEPRFMAVCGSPMPMMTGVDFDAAAMEIERRTGIRTLALHTNGTRHYTEGASEAFLEIIREYVRPVQNKTPCGVNILGAMPLDFGITGTIESLKQWLSANGFQVVSSVAMGDTLDNISSCAAGAQVNLVIAFSGLAAAEYLYDTFGIPYVCGFPTGTAFSAAVADSLRKAIATGSCQFPCAEGNTASAGQITVIGESIVSASVAADLALQTGKTTHVICPVSFEAACMNGETESLSFEDEIEKALAENPPEFVVADPLYRYILPQNTRLIELPHFAFSGRCFDKRIPDLCKVNFMDLVNEV